MLQTFNVIEQFLIRYSLIVQRRCCFSASHRFCASFPEAGQYDGEFVGSKVGAVRVVTSLIANHPFTIGHPKHVVAAVLTAHVMAVSETSFANLMFVFKAQLWALTIFFA